MGNLHFHLMVAIAITFGSHQLNSPVARGANFETPAAPASETGLPQNAEPSGNRLGAFGSMRQFVTSVFSLETRQTLWDLATGLKHPAQVTFTWNDDARRVELKLER